MKNLSSNCAAKPFVKWAGGKGQLLNEIRKKYPVELGGRINKYAEPFIGGGAVLFDVLNHYVLNEVYISDINQELIHTYITIRDCVNELIQVLQEYENKYLPADADERKIIYYENRDKFNRLKLTNDGTPELAALFIFLNRTCFNGLYRVNAKGSFNVPQGSYKKPCICDESNLRAVSEKLRGVKIVCGDYKLASDFIDSRTFAYFDPPYRPLTTTANFTSYVQDGSNDTAQAELAEFIDSISEKGAHVVASNSELKNTTRACALNNFTFKNNKRGTNSMNYIHTAPLYTKEEKENFLLIKRTLIDEAIRFPMGTREEQVKIVINNFASTEVAFLKPGKEVFREKPNANDMYPLVTFNGSEVTERFTFEDIWEYLLKIFLIHKGTFTKALILLYRLCFYTDHACIDGKWRYLPSDEILKLINGLDELVLKDGFADKFGNDEPLSLLQFLLFVDLLAWNEDVKYHVPKGAPYFKNMTESKTGRTNTILSLISAPVLISKFIEDIVAKTQTGGVINVRLITGVIQKFTISRGLCILSTAELQKSLSPYLGGE